MLTLNITPTLTLIIILILTLPWTKNPIITLTLIKSLLLEISSQEQFSAGVHVNVGSPSMHYIVLKQNDIQSLIKKTLSHKIVLVNSTVFSWSSESAGNHQKTPSDLPAIVLNDIYCNAILPYRCQIMYITYGKVFGGTPNILMFWIFPENGSISERTVNPFSTGTGWTLYKVYGGFRISSGTD